MKLLPHSQFIVLGCRVFIGMLATNPTPIIMATYAGGTMSLSRSYIVAYYYGQIHYLD